MQSIHDILDFKFAGNTVADWGIAILAFLVTFTVLPLLKSYLLRLAKRPTQALEHGAVKLLLQLIPRTSRLFMWVVALNVANRFLEFPSRIASTLHVLIYVGIWFQVGLWAMTTVQYFLERQRARGESDAGFASSLGIINFVARIIIWTVVSLLALDNLGINITALVAGLGVGGIAIALAVQTVLGDLLASLSIALDKPFAIGDNLALDDINGKVEQISIRSTRIRSASGEQIIVSNADLLKSRVRNFGRMEERRGIVNIGITYETSRDKVEQTGKLIEQAIRSQPGVRLERCHFKEFGASALNFEAVYFVLEPHFDALMEAQQAINFKILEAFEKEGIEFAYPTQKLFVANSKNGS
jgi:small-conductance mechanosensitive channel